MPSSTTPTWQNALLFTTPPCFHPRFLLGTQPSTLATLPFGQSSRQNDFFDAILHGFHVNEVAVVVVKDQNVRVVTDGQNKETAGGVRVDLAGGGLAVGVQEMCFESRWFRS